MNLTISKALNIIFNDICIMAALLVIGQILRAKVKIFQKLLIPAALIAGFLALILGPQGFSVLKFSSGFGTYAGILITVIFAATPIGDKPNKEAMSGTVIGGMFFNITGIAVLQYAIGMLVTMYGLKYFFNDLPNEFGLMMATGFYGGHGTAVAVGKALEDLGIANMTDFGNTCATIGIVGGIVFGMAIINWGARKGYTHYVNDPQELPSELRTGLIPPEKQKSAGKITISAICLDPMSFHIGLVLLASVGGILISKYFKIFTAKMGYGVAIPEFCTALLCGFVINAFINKTKVHEYVDRSMISRVQGVATDFLMVSGIGSLNLSVVLNYAVPLLVVCGIGFIITFWWFIYVGGKSSREDWFERNMMCWGHATGVAATGVLLQRVVDPDLRSRGIEDSGIADLFNRPLIIGLQVLPPIIMSLFPIKGGHIVTWVSLGIVLFMWIIAWKLKWWVPSQKLKKYK